MILNIKQKKKSLVLPPNINHYQTNTILIRQRRSSVVRAPELVIFRLLGRRLYWALNVVLSLEKTLNANIITGILCGVEDKHRSMFHNSIYSRKNEKNSFIYLVYEVLAASLKVNRVAIALFLTSRR